MKVPDITHAEAFDDTGDGYSATKGWFIKCLWCDWYEVAPTKAAGDALYQEHAERAMSDEARLIVDHAVHACISCSPNPPSAPGRGCVNCRGTGYDQTPCVDCPGTGRTWRGRGQRHSQPVDTEAGNGD